MKRIIRLNNINDRNIISRNHNDIIVKTYICDKFDNYVLCFNKNDIIK